MRNNLRLCTNTPLTCGHGKKEQPEKPGELSGWRHGMSGVGMVCFMYFTLFKISISSFAPSITAGAMN